MTVAGDPLIGTEFLGYRIEELIGRGGMSIVYQAEDLRLKRKVALKLLTPELAEDVRFRERFLRESELAASLDHPNIVPIYGAGDAESRLWIAMRYVSGGDLKALLRSGIEPERALSLLQQVADALDAAHEQGLIHRDVKPGNVLLDSRDHCYLSDFGLTKQVSSQSGFSATGQIVGTIDYVAPEVIEGKHLDSRADLYSLGCLLYEALVSEPPFRRDTELAVLWAHVNEPPPKASKHNPRLDESIDGVLAKALAKEPQKRYASGRELVDAARDALGLREVVVVRDRRSLVLAGLGALIAAGAIAVGLALALGNGGEAKPDLTVRNNTLVRIDPQENEIAAVTPVGRRVQLVAGAVSVAVGEGTVWVHNWDAQTVSAIDSETNTVERTVSIGGSMPYVTANSIAADDDGAWVITQESGKGVLTRVGPRLELPREYTFDYDPLAVAVGLGSVWVAAKSVNGSALLRIDPDTGSTLDTVPLPAAAINFQTQFRDVQAISVGEGAAWVLYGGVIFRIDPTSARITGRVDLPGSEAADVEARDGAVWATAFAPRGNVLVRVDPRTLRITKMITAPIAYGSSLYSALAVGDGAVWWNGAESGTIWRVDPRTGRIVASIRLTPQVETVLRRQPLAIAAGGGNVWVTVSVAP